MFHLERDLGAHGKAVRDDRLLVNSFTVPAVQFHTPATG